MKPLTPERQKMVIEYLAVYNPVAHLRKAYPGTVNLATKFRCIRDDLYALCLLGVVIAASRWEPNRGRTFKSYIALWMRGIVSSTADKLRTDSRRARVVCGDWIGRDGASYFDMIVAEKKKDDSQKELVEIALACLSHNDRLEVKSRFGIGGYEEKTAEERGAAKGITRTGQSARDQKIIDQIRRRFAEKES
jgi:DNA-directed RNA polymerase specialized sigma subunit